MHFFKLIQQSLAISFKHKVLWLFALVPTVFLVLCLSIFFYAFYSPIVNLYSLFANAEGQSAMTLLTMMQNMVIDGIMFLAPLLMVFLAIAILSKNAIIKSIQLIVEGQHVDVRSAWAASRGYFGPTLVLLLTIVGLSLSIHFVEIFVRHLGVYTSIFATISLAMEVLIVLSSLFSLHYVLIHNDPVLMSLRKSFHLSTAHFSQLFLLFIFLLIASIVLLCLMGAVVGISYYTSMMVGMLIGLLLMTVLIPVNIFLTTLWTLFYMSLADIQKPVR